MKRILTALAATTIAIAAPATPAFAQAAPAGYDVGMQVVDTAGNPVGTVAATDAQFVTVKTDKHSIPVPAESFTAHEGKLLFAMSASALNASYEQALADAAASVAVGKPFRDVTGAEVGTIDEVTDAYIQLALANDKVVRVPAENVQGDAAGAIALYELSALQADAVERPEAPVEAPAEDAMAEDHSGHDMGEADAE